MGINNLLYQYQNTNEFVCSDGRMSVNGICQAPQPVVEQPVIKQPVINNNQGNGDSRDTFTKDYSKDVKSNFQWDFDKVGNKIGNFGTTVKDNINAYDKYVEDNLGIDKNVSTGFRAISTGLGIAKYGALGAVAPFAIPFMAGGALNNKQQKENERITNITNQDTQGGNNTVDMATYGIPTAGQPGFNIHNDKYDQGNSVTGNSGTGSAGRGGASPGSAGPGGSDSMGSF
jgi:hypothetical protein